MEERMDGGVDLVGVRRALRPPEVARHLITGQSD